MLALQQRKLIAEVDQEFPVAKSLPSWQYHDARQVEIVLRILLLTEVANYMVPIGLSFTEYIKVESVNLIPDVLMIEEKFGYVTQVLSVDLLLLCVELKHTNFIVAVNLITWRAPYIASLRVSLQLTLLCEEEQAEGTDVQRPAMVLRREV